MFNFHFKKIFSDGREKVTDSQSHVWWYKHGAFHRNNDMPAIFYKDGEMAWYKKGTCIKRKNIDGKVI